MEQGRRAGDESALRHCLDEIVGERFGRQARVAEVRRSRLPAIGSYDCDAVTVMLEDGGRLALFLKDFAVSRLSKDDRELRRVRELNVYRDLLAPAELGTPHYYGSLWDESEGRFWLILEHVDGAVLKQVDAESGALAATWLARFQSHFLPRRDLLESCEWLIRHDATFFRSKAEAARRDVALLGPSSCGAFGGVLERYERAIDVMLAQPQTLVHGGYIPWHVLIDARREPTRVCAVDWELAALGATLYDLAIFTDGLDDAVRAPIERAYRDAALALRIPLPEVAEMLRVMDCFRLHRILDWLSRSVEKQFSERKVEKLVAQAGRVARRALD
jgi:hypothetical protein